LISIYIQLEGAAFDVFPDVDRFSVLGILEGLNSRDKVIGNITDIFSSTYALDFYDSASAINTITISDFEE
jgi:hypothetical protein